MRKSFLFIAVIISVIVIASSCKTKQQTSKISGAKKVAATETTTPAPVTSEEKTMLNEVTRNEKFSAAEGEDVRNLVRKYHVVVGSFSVKNNAKSLQQTLKSEGYDALMVINEAGMYRVLIASFDRYADARTQINKLANRFSDAWVLVQK